MNPADIYLPSGKLSHNYGKSPFSMGKSTISMAIFNSYFDITRGYPHPKSDPALWRQQLLYPLLDLVEPMGTWSWLRPSKRLELSVFTWVSLRIDRFSCWSWNPDLYWPIFTEIQIATVSAIIIAIWDIFGLFPAPHSRHQHDQVFASKAGTAPCPVHFASRKLPQLSPEVDRPSFGGSPRILWYDTRPSGTMELLFWAAWTSKSSTSMGKGWGKTMKNPNSRWFIMISPITCSDIQNHPWESNEQIRKQWICLQIPP